jgi:hypothetical protein
MTPEEFAKGLHNHILRQLRKTGGMAIGLVTDTAGGSPATVSVTLRGSQTPIDGVRYDDGIVWSNYTTFPEVIVMLSGDGDIVVTGVLAS